jgi:hypothetical protein
MLAKALLWWPAATTISGFIIAAVAVVAGTVSLSLSILVLCLAAALWTPTLRMLWSVADPTADWTYFNKSVAENSSRNNFRQSPAEQLIYVWPTITGIAAWGTVNSWKGKRPITLCKSDAEVERAIAAGNSAATEWRPTLSKLTLGIPLVPVLTEGDVVPTWATWPQETPKCRITYGPALQLTANELRRSAKIWAEHLNLAKALCEEKRPAKKSATK